MSSPPQDPEWLYQMLTSAFYYTVRQCDDILDKDPRSNVSHIYDWIRLLVRVSRRLCQICSPPNSLTPCTAHTHQVDLFDRARYRLVQRNLCLLGRGQPKSGRLRLLWQRVRVLNIAGG